MDIDIFEVIDNLMSYINSLTIPRKRVKDVLTADEFNSVVDKITEIGYYLNNNTKTVVIDTTAYLMNRIDSLDKEIYGSTIKLNPMTEKTINDEINSIWASLNIVDDKVDANTESITSLNSQIVSLEELLGVTRRELEEEIDGSYISAIAYSMQYTDDKIAESYSYTMNEVKSYVVENVEESYQKANEYTNIKVDDAYSKLYTYITDTTLTFDYDVYTDNTSKRIYDNSNDLYDGSYHN